MTRKVIVALLAGPLALSSMLVGHAAPMRPLVTCGATSTLLASEGHYFTLDGITNGGYVWVDIRGAYTTGMGNGSNCLWVQLGIKTTNYYSIPPPNDIADPANLGFNEYYAPSSDGVKSGPWSLATWWNAPFTNKPNAAEITASSELTGVTFPPDGDCVAIQDGTTEDTNFISYVSGLEYSADAHTIPFVIPAVCPTT